MPLAPLLLCLMLTASSGQTRAIDPTAVADTSAPAATEAEPSPEPPGASQGTTAGPPDSGAPPPAPAHTGVRAVLIGVKDDITHLPTKQNIWIAGIGGALALATHPLDQTVNVRVLNQYSGVNAFFSPGKYLGDTPEQVAFSIGTWVLGRVWDKPRVSHLGMDLLRAQAVTEILVEPLKFATRRERPDGSNRQSFPSGHAAITFAAATVIERHLGWKHSILAYALASYVAASRLHDNRHYLSDVVFGAVVGSIAGRTVTAHGRDHWMASVMPVPGGAAIGVSLTGF